MHDAAHPRPNLLHRTAHHAETDAMAMHHLTLDEMFRRIDEDLADR